MTYTNACMSSTIDLIRPRTTELAAIERLKKIPYTYNGENKVISFSSLFIGFFFILAVSNEDMHESLDEFEFWPGSITDYGVSCPSASYKAP